MPYLIKGKANIDYSFVTGESELMIKNEGEFLYSGGRQSGESIIVEVTKLMGQSYLTQLWNQDTFKKQTQARIASVVDKISGYFTFTILIIACITGAFWAITDSSVMLNAVTSVLIVACPCALALAMPFAFGNSTRILGRNGFYLKNSTVIETISKVTTLVFDKTGTITHNEFNSVEFEGETLSEKQFQLIKSVVRHSTHPLSKSIFRSISDNIKCAEVEFFNEFPGKGMVAKMEAIEVKLGSSEFVMGKIIKDLGTRVYVSINGELIGFYRFETCYRSGIDNTAQQLGKEYQLHILSGDNNKEMLRLRKMFGAKTNMNFNQSPLDKLNYIKDLKYGNEKVMMLGDGLNDAGALKESNVGVSVSDDVYNFSPASDAILEASKLIFLPKFINFANATMLVLKLGFILSFLYNVVGLMFAVSGQLTPLVAAILMPASSVTIVAFVTLGTSAFGRKLFS